MYTHSMNETCIHTNGARVSARTLEIEVEVEMEIEVVSEWKRKGNAKATI